MNPTDLILESLDQRYPFPPFSARECTQSLSLIETSSLRRTINGKLVSLAPLSHRKFTSTIICQDKISPGFENLSAGMELKVGCIQSLTVTLSKETRDVILERLPVSCHLYDQEGNLLKIEKEDGQKITLPPDFSGGFITYRPWLHMLIKTYQMETDEWASTVRWRLELVEI